MRVVGYKTAGPVDHPGSLHDVELPDPQPTGRDLLVEVRAVSVNPVDTKVRQRSGAEDGRWKVLGYDAAGVVTAVGPEASLFKPGDAVFFHCNTLHSAGTNRSDAVKFSLVYTYHGVSNPPQPGTRSASHPEISLR